MSWRTSLLVLAIAGCAPAYTHPDAELAARQAERERQERELGHSLGWRPGATAPTTPIADRYRGVAATIIAAARADDAAWQKLEHLCDRIGHRLSGSAALEQAVAWATAAMVADGHENVRAEPVMVPHWIRGAERGAIVTPVSRPLHLLALGGSPGTRRGGVTGEVVRVASFEELERLGPAGVKDKVVLFDRPLTLDARGRSSYGDAAPYRGKGPSRAAELGARAAMVRSLATRSLSTPHTGSTRFADGVAPIPAVAISVEDALLIGRLLAAGDRVTVTLELGARTLPDARSANVIGELVGRERPDEVVVLGGHLDSWDVGQGAHDDGGGVVASMQALTVLRRLGLTPRRTIRVVLWTNEENGLAGANEYARAHAAEIGKHVLGIEMDGGAFPPRGFTIQGGERAVADARDIASLLGPIGASEIEAGDHAGADLTPLIEGGMPGAGLRGEAAAYFDYHHSEADTLDKVEPAALKDNVAALAILAYVAADMPARFGGGG